MQFESDKQSPSSWILRNLPDYLEPAAQSRQARPELRTADIKIRPWTEGDYLQSLLWHCHSMGKIPDTRCSWKKCKTVKNESCGAIYCHLKCLLDEQWNVVLFYDAGKYWWSVTTRGQQNVRNGTVASVSIVNKWRFREDLDMTPNRFVVQNGSLASSFPAASVMFNFWNTEHCVFCCCLPTAACNVSWWHIAPRLSGTTGHRKLRGKLKPQV